MRRHTRARPASPLPIAPAVQARRERGVDAIGRPRLQSIEIGERTRGQRAALGERLLGAAQPRAVGAAARRLRERREQPEIDVHRLERARPGVDRLDMPAGDVGEQRAVRRGRRRHVEGLAAPLGGGEASGHQADRGAFDIAFAAGDLAGKAQARHRTEPQRAVEQLRRVEEGVAVKAAEPREFRVLEAGDHAEHPHLLGMLELGLEADDVEQGAEAIVLAQLHDGVRLLSRPVRIGEPDRLHRPPAQRVATALRHHLDRQAAVEIGGLLPVVERARSPARSASRKASYWLRSSGQLM